MRRLVPRTARACPLRAAAPETLCRRFPWAESSGRVDRRGSLLSWATGGAPGRRTVAGTRSPRDGREHL
jgi:hypothetical protein